MNPINRSAVLVTPKGPYFAWAANIDAEAGSAAESLRDKTAVYSVEAAESDEEELIVLERHYEAIFDAELRAWAEDESLWPQFRNLATFRTWFDVEFQSLVVDLGCAPFETDSF